MKKCQVVKIIGISNIPDSKLKWIISAINGNEPITFVAGDHYEEGQLGFLIPEGAVLPEKLLREMWLWNEQTNKGRLSGKHGNRTKSKKIDGVISNYLFYGAYYIHEKNKIISPSWNPEWQEGHDVTEEVGIVFK